MHTHIQSNLQVSLEVRECIIIQNSSYKFVRARTVGYLFIDRIQQVNSASRFAGSNAEREIHKLSAEIMFRTCSQTGEVEHTVRFFVWDVANNNLESTALDIFELF